MYQVLEIPETQLWERIKMITEKNEYMNLIQDKISYQFNFNSRPKKSLTFVDLFSGVGGFRLGMEKAGHRCLGFCEIDPYARKSYKAIHDTKNEVEMHDITKLSDDFIRGLGHVDVLCGGFPCQAFSIAGKRKGFSDTRGTLFFEIARFASLLRPKYLFLENVKGLLNHDNGNTFETILGALDELGYNVEWTCINSKDYIPQNRERIYIIGHLRESSTELIFPISRESESACNQSEEIHLAGTTHEANNLSTHTRERTYYTSGVMGCLTATDFKSPKQIVVGNVNPSERGMNGFVYNSEGLSPTLTTNNGEGNKIAIPVLTPERLEKRQNGRRFKNNQEEMFSITTQDRHGIMIYGELPGTHRQSSCVVSTEGVSPTLMTMQGGGQEPKIAVRESTKKGYAEATIGDSINLSFPGSSNRRGRVGKGKAHTLLTGNQQGIVTENFQIRKLTPLECWRLQAFPDWAFLAAKFDSKEIALDIIERNLDHYDCEYDQKMSNHQLYKQAGNSVTATVIYEIAKHFK